MELKDLIKKNRSYRRFDGNHKVSREELLEMIDLTRLTPSAGNMQPLRYYLVTEPAQKERVFHLLKWASYLNWAGPKESEKPAAYIIIIADLTINKNPLVDVGIVSQTILLQAVERGLGGCNFLSVDRESLKKDLKLPEHYEVLTAIAIGKPAEEIILEETDSDIKYWRDENDCHHVPKRKLEDLIIRS